MNIGSTIKKLRRQKDLTQEQLAEYLNVSVSAVSQWESGKTAPDISLIVPLANFFDVSIDVLFDRGTEIRDVEMASYRQRSEECAHKGDIPGKIAVWREAMRKYPGDFGCMTNLACALEDSLSSGGCTEELEANAKEAVGIFERILRDCTDNSLRNKAVNRLVCIYSDRDFSIADEAKAVEYARMAGRIFDCADVLLARAYFTEASRDQQTKQRHLNNLNFMDMLCMNLYYHHKDTPEAQIFACETAAVLWKTLIYDGNFLFFHCRMQKIYQILAYNHAKLGNKAESLAAIGQALYHAGQYDEQQEGEQHYTSEFVAAASENIEKYTKNFTESNTAVVRKWLRSSVFDFIRDEPEFKAFSITES